VILARGQGVSVGELFGDPALENGIRLADKTQNLVHWAEDTTEKEIVEWFADGDAYEDGLRMASASDGACDPREAPAAVAQPPFFERKAVATRATQGDGPAPTTAGFRATAAAPAGQEPLPPAGESAALTAALQDIWDSVSEGV
jgi:hypothetical protein